jgi:hypothetical protein
MTIHGTEVLGPEELVELGAIFDDTWAAMGNCTSSEWSSSERARLASILFRLFGLKRLGPDQARQTALRIFRQGSASNGNGASLGDGFAQALSVPPERATRHEA